MSEIIVKSQAEWDAIPKDFYGIVYINADREAVIIVKEKRGWRVDARGNASVVARGNASVVARENASVVARENASVDARENASVDAWGNASVVARGNASVVARENASVDAWGNASVDAWGNASVDARGNASVVAWGNAFVDARENASVDAWGNASVVARGNASVVARGNASVVAGENASVDAWGNASVVARGNASVVAGENASVDAWGNASVDGKGNTQIAKYSDDAKLTIAGNARIVTLPETVEGYCDFYGVGIKNGHAVLYKAVHKDEDIYRSSHDRDFKYTVGATAENRCDPDISRACSYGLHVSHKAWAIDFGRGWSDLAILECLVPLDCIVVPKNNSGKVRTSQLTVVREVPLEECGIWGKVLARSRAA